ncbi:Gmad2 immunoglobulin-like domain-containing protein [Nocardioides sp. CN2-186]|uniref:Gmad2 immunoglobulin-like domain-containing protein n=1 Tax=Nocardioides tweenelious TaxID=3156607 RepID=UPI0032B4D2B0
MSARARLALVLTASVVALAGCGDSAGDDQKPTSNTTKHHHNGGKTSEAADPSESATGSSDTVTVPVYFVGDTRDGTKLFREFRKVEADNPADEALALMTAGDALDPDYDTLYPDGSFGGVEIGDDAITVALADDAWTTAPDGMSQGEARLAAQQLVYTVQGVAQSRLPVEITLDGAPADLFGLGGELSNEPEIDVRALVNVTTPEQGASVNGTFTASGVSSSFEATTPWEIRDGDGKVVAKGFSTADGWMDKLYPWETLVDVSDLAPGDYTFVAMTDDPSGGEGSGPTEDSKAITVS